MAKETGKPNSELSSLYEYKAKTFEELPKKLQLFVDEYMKDFNQTKAMQRCGVQNPGTANRKAWMAMKNPLVQQEIGRRLAIRYAENEVTVQRVLEELAEIGFVKLNDVQKIMHSQNKLRALELLGRHLGMWNDKIDVNVKKTFEQELQEILEEDDE